MTVKLVHASGNGTKLSAPAANPSADINLKVPSTTGSAGQVLSVASANHSSTNAELTWTSEYRKVWGSTVDTTSGTDHVLLSSIPADCNRFGWGLYEVSVGTDGDFGVQMSTSGGYVTSNYKSAQSWLRTGSSGTNDISDAFISCTPPSSDWGAGYKFTGNFEVNRIKDNIWTFTGQARGDESNEHTVWASGFVNLGGTLTAIRLHSEQTLDNGAIRAWYETGGA